jgi:hypothetical protein
MRGRSGHGFDHLRSIVPARTATKAKMRAVINQSQNSWKNLETAVCRANTLPQLMHWKRGLRLSSKTNGRMTPPKATNATGEYITGPSRRWAPSRPQEGHWTVNHFISQWRRSRP